MYVFVICNFQQPGSYVYRDPKTQRSFKFDYCPIYVSSGEGDRIYSYYNMLARKYHLDPLLVKDFSKFKVAFSEVGIIVQDNLSEEDAFELENMLKTIIGMEYNETGPLKNKTMKYKYGSDPDLKFQKNLKLSGRFLARLLNFSYEKMRLMIVRGYIKKDEEGYSLDTIFTFIKDRNLKDNVNKTILQDLFKLYPGSDKLYDNIVLDGGD